MVSCHCRYRVFSASAWLTLLTRNTVWPSVSELYVTARLGSLLVKMTSWPWNSVILLDCFITTRVKSSSGWRRLKRTDLLVLRSSSFSVTSRSTSNPNLLDQHLLTGNWSATLNC